MARTVIAAGLLFCLAASILSRQCAFAAVPDAPADTAGAAKGRAEQPNAAELVRHVREEEARVAQVRSLYLRFKAKSTTTAAGLALRRTALVAQYGEGLVPAERLAELRPERVEDFEIAFDDHRLREESNRHDFFYELRLWDGRRAYTHQKSFTHEEDNHAFDNRQERLVGELFLNNLPWLWSAPHNFWWCKQELPGEILASVYGGKPEDFELVRPRVYRERRCFELKSRLTPDYRLFIGAADRHLYGFKRLELPAGAEELAAMGILVGRALANPSEAEGWAKSLGGEVLREYTRMLDEVGRPVEERYLDDYREIAAGLWLPAKQGYLSYDGKCNEVPLTSRRDWELVEVKVNEPLADSLFTIPAIPDGAKVFDYAYDPPLGYKQQADRTPQEWAAMVEQHQRAIEERKKRDEQRKRAVKSD